MIISKKELNKVILEELQKEFKEKNINEASFGSFVDKIKEKIPFTKESEDQKVKLGVILNTLEKLVESVKPEFITRTITNFANKQNVDNYLPRLFKSLKSFPNETIEPLSSLIKQYNIKPLQVEAAEDNLLSSITKDTKLDINDNFVFTSFRLFLSDFILNIVLSFTADYIRRNENENSKEVENLISKRVEIQNKYNSFFTNVAKQTKTSGYVSIEGNLQNINKLLKDNNDVNIKAIDDTLKQINKMISNVEEKAKVDRYNFAYNLLNQFKQYFVDIYKEFNDSLTSKINIAKSGKSEQLVAPQVISHSAEAKLTFISKSSTPEILPAQKGSNTNAQQRQIGTGSALTRESKEKSKNLLEESTKKRFKTLANIK